MGAEHGHQLHVHGDSPLHRMAAHHKVLLVVGFVLLIVATPAGTFWPYAVHATLLIGAVALSRVPPAYLARRMAVEVPFVVFALWLPLVATGPRMEVAGLSLSEAGLVAAGGLLAKGTLGVLTALLLAATTDVRDLLEGLRRLRMPAALVEIMGFMVRYLDVVGGELRRMRVALLSRGFDPRSPRHWPVLARALGALFVRSYERGERVHLAMVSRGYRPQASRR